MLQSQIENRNTPQTHLNNLSKMSEKKWYYFSGNKQVGPVSAETIQELLGAGVLNLNTQVWTQGFENWKPIETVDEFHVDYPPTIPPVPQTVTTIEEVQNPEISGLQIRPWVRYWARLMDFFLFSLLSGLVLGIIFPPALEINGTLLGILLLFVYVFVEPIMLTSWGTTPGKALLRVRLRKSNGKKPTYLEALGRSVSVWVGGWGLGIPIVALITLITAYKKLKKDGITRWDGGRYFNVSHRQIGAIRIIITILIFISFVFLIVLEEKSKG